MAREFSYIFDNIKQKISEYNVFKNDKDLLIRLLTQAIDKIFIEIQFQYFLSMFERTPNTDLTILLNHAQDSYRAILKFIMEFSINQNENIVDKDEIINEFYLLFEEFGSKFNEIRNRFERYELNLLDLLYDEETMTITQLTDFSKRSMFIRIKQHFDLEKEDTLPKKLQLMNYFISRSETKKNKIKTFYNSNKNDEIFRTLYEICYSDSELKCNISFGDFEYNDIISICASLLYIAIYKISSDLINFKEGNDIDFAVEYEKAKLIDIIKLISKLPEDKIEKIINYMIYNFEYQKNKLTLIQHLITLKNGNIIFSSFLMIVGNLPAKVYRTIIALDKNKYKYAIAEASRIKESQMINSAIKLCKDALHIRIVPNFKYFKESDSIKNIAEYDMIFYDENEKFLLICECKWFFMGDGESEHNVLSERLLDNSNKRISRDKYVLENIDDFTYKCFSEKLEVSEIHSIMLSQNFEGEQDYLEGFPIVDAYTFKQIMINKKFNIKNAYQSFVDNEIYSDFKYENKDVRFEYLNYKFNLKQIAINYK